MSDPTTKCGHIALAGAPNIGKSALLNTLVGSHLAIVSGKAQSTRLPVTGLRTDGTTQYIFHDLPGLMDPRYALQERMRAAALETLDRADVILHLHPAPEAPAPAFETVARLATPPRAPVRLVYTKADLVPTPRREALADGAADAEGSVAADGSAEGVIDRPKLGDGLGSAAAGSSLEPNAVCSNHHDSHRTTSRPTTRAARRRQ